MIIHARRSAIESCRILKPKSPLSKRMEMGIKCQISFCRIRAAHRNHHAETMTVLDFQFACAYDVSP